MLDRKRNWRLIGLGTVGAAVLGLATLSVPLAPAQAQMYPYLGIDLGGGVGIGLGVPPSAYYYSPYYSPYYAPYYTPYYRPFYPY